MLSLLSIELIEQYTCVRRGSIHLECFVNVNGVKQGRILSLLFFNVYMDSRSSHLHMQSIGCSVGGTVVNHMLYMQTTSFCFLPLRSPSAKG